MSYEWNLFFFAISSGLCCGLSLSLLLLLLLVEDRDIAVI